jgi:hypothetical protein
MEGYGGEMRPPKLRSGDDGFFMTERRYITALKQGKLSPHEYTALQILHSFASHHDGKGMINATSLMTYMRITQDQARRALENLEKERYIHLEPTRDRKLYPFTLLNYRVKGGAFLNTDVQPRAKPRVKPLKSKVKPLESKTSPPPADPHADVPADVPADVGADVRAYVGFAATVAPNTDNPPSLDDLADVDAYLNPHVGADVDADNTIRKHKKDVGAVEGSKEEKEMNRLMDECSSSKNGNPETKTDELFYINKFSDLMGNPKHIPISPESEATMVEIKDIVMGEGYDEDHFHYWLKWMCLINPYSSLSEGYLGKAQFPVQSLKKGTEQSLRFFKAHLSQWVGQYKKAVKARGKATVPHGKVLGFPAVPEISDALLATINHHCADGGITREELILLDDKYLDIVLEYMLERTTMFPCLRKIERLPDVFVFYTSTRHILFEEIDVPEPSYELPAATWDYLWDHFDWEDQYSVRHDAQEQAQRASSKSKLRWGYNLIHHPHEEIIK